MQRCELAEECCVCDVALCPYERLDDTLDEKEEEDDDSSI